MKSYLDRISQVDVKTEQCIPIDIWINFIAISIPINLLCVNGVLFYKVERSTRKKYHEEIPCNSTLKEAREISVKSLLVLQNFTIARKSGNIALAY